MQFCGRQYVRTVNYVKYVTARNLIGPCWAPQLSTTIEVWNQSALCQPNYFVRGTSSLSFSLFGLDPFLSAFILCQRNQEMALHLTSLSALGNSLCASNSQEWNLVFRCANITTLILHTCLMPLYALRWRSFSPACNVARVIAPASAIHAAFSSTVKLLLCLFLRLAFYSSALLWP